VSTNGDLRTLKVLCLRPFVVIGHMSTKNADGGAIPVAATAGSDDGYDRKHRRSAAGQLGGPASESQGSAAAVKFRSLLLLDLVLLVTFTVAATVGAVALVQSRSAKRQVVEEVIRSRQVFEELHEHRKSLFRAQARVVAAEPRVKAVVSAADITTETVLGVAQELRQAVASDLLLLTDAEGSVLADASNPAATGLSLADEPLVASSLEVGQADGIWIQGAHVYQVEASRLAFGANVVGVLLVGFEVDDRIAEMVRRQTGSSVLVELGSRLIAGAVPGEARRTDGEVERGLDAIATGTDAPVEVTLSGTRFLAVAVPYPGYAGGELLRYVVIRSLDQALAPGRTLLRIVCIIATVSVLGAILIAAAVARSLSRPIDDLVAYTRRVAAGEESLGASISGPVELKALGHAMTGMVAELQALKEGLERRVEERTEQLSRANDGLAREMAARAKMEVELRQAQKLEAVGRLAAGVAHEINTPVQFVSDSVHFVRGALSDITHLIEKYRALNRAALEGTSSIEAVRDIIDAEEQADVDYVLDAAPKALARSLDGLERIANIVRSMKEFAHPEQKDKVSVDLNRAISTTLTIASTEYKYVAEVETDLGEIPAVVCYAGEINQAILNLIVNAAHAIGARVDGTDRKGLIKIATRVEADCVVISITDTGTGIPEEIRDRIFDPFFTTKEVGKGTGQGLAIARSVVTEKHGGTLTFVSEVGVGTTFFLRLPNESVAVAPVAAA
jgi:signal transduction histidine kinase